MNRQLFVAIVAVAVVCACNRPSVEVVVEGSNAPAVGDAQGSAGGANDEPAARRVADVFGVNPFITIGEATAYECREPAFTGLQRGNAYLKSVDCIKKGDGSLELTFVNDRRAGGYNGRLAMISYRPLDVGFSNDAASALVAKMSEKYGEFTDLGSAGYAVLVDACSGSKPCERGGIIVAKGPIGWTARFSSGALTSAYEEAALADRAVGAAAAK